MDEIQKAIKARAEYLAKHPEEAQGQEILFLIESLKKIPVKVEVSYYPASASILGKVPFSCTLNP